MGWATCLYSPFSPCRSPPSCHGPYRHARTEVAMHPEPPRTSGKVLRRYIVEEAVYPEVSATDWHSTSPPAVEPSRAYRFGWDATDWMLRHPGIAGVVLTVVVVAAVVLSIHLTWGIRLGPPCPST